MRHGMTGETRRRGYPAAQRELVSEMRERLAVASRAGSECAEPACGVWDAAASRANRRPARPRGSFLELARACHLGLCIAEAPTAGIVVGIGQGNGRQCMTVADGARRTAHG